MFRELSIAAFFLAVQAKGGFTCRSGVLRRRHQYADESECPLGVFCVDPLPQWAEAAEETGLPLPFVQTVAAHADNWIVTMTDATKAALSLATGVPLP
jgi:hypothetical protein